MTKEEAKHLSEILKAYSEGKTIQTINMRIPGADWEDTNDIVLNSHVNRYRIKPEPKYRPYNNVEEFLKAQKEHGVYIKGFGIYEIPIQIVNSGIYLPINHYVDWKTLYISYKLQDETPCGILEE